MKLWSDFKGIAEKKILFTDIFLVLFSVILISPYVILSYFNNPSIDDYSFVFNVNTQGFWKAIATWYMTWTGRYFSMFVLSIHPLLIDSVALYKLISIILLLLTVHSLYQFINTILGSLNRITNLFLSVAISFCFLNEMPNLVQGIYWEPGAITYQLANILSLYLGINLIRSISTDYTGSVFYKIINGTLIIAICGLNETSMIVVDLFLVCVFVYDTLSQRKIKPELLVYILLAIVCSLVVILAPGNVIRDTVSTDINKHQVPFSIISSGKASYHYILKWLFSPPIIITSFLIIIAYVTAFKEHVVKTKNKIIIFIFIAIGGSGLIVASLIPAFWSTGILPPSRTLNVTYWLFICTWCATLLSLLSFADPFLKAIRKWNYVILNYLLFFALLLSVKKTENYYTAIKDIISGKALIYDKEFRERDRIMRTSKEAICEIPSFSVHPKSIFNEDITADEKNWWNYMYAHYYKQAPVRVAYKEPYFSVKYFFNFESENNKLLDNQNTITNEIAFSQPNSSLLAGQDSYSATFRETIKDIGVDNINDITTAHVSVQFYSTDSVINAVLVVCVSDTVTKKDVLWMGKEIVSTNYSKNKWMKEEYPVSLSKEFLKPGNKIVTYVWNRGKSKLFIDDLHLTIY